MAKTRLTHVPNDLFNLAEFIKQEGKLNHRIDGFKLISGINSWQIQKIDTQVIPKSKRRVVTIFGKLRLEL